MSMKCPKCNNYFTVVTNTKDLEESVKRTRKCLKCDHRFATSEEVDNTIVVIKRGRRMDDE